MITIQSAMLVALGIFAAGFFGFLFAPLYRRRTTRLAIESLKRSMPLSEAEIRADKDRLRAEYAIAIHKLETKLEESTLAFARQRVEINRRDAAISGLESEVARLGTNLDEQENARRVLEQIITERLPKVEHRLSQAQVLLSQRDLEVTDLANTAGSHAHALEEATQINTKQRDELHRLKATLATRAAHSRDSFSDEKMQGEIALRAEIESLRAKARDQAQLISRLQAAKRLAAAGLPAGIAAGGGPHDVSASFDDPAGEIARLRDDLAEAQKALMVAQGESEGGNVKRSGLETELSGAKARLEDQASEIAKLKAALLAYEADASQSRATKETKVAMKARLSALQAETSEQTAIIQRLRAEVAAANDKLARQAAHYVDEMRRLGVGTVPATGRPRRTGAEVQHRPPLMERITAPRSDGKSLVRPASTRTGTRGDGQSGDQVKISGFLRALSGDDAKGAPAKVPAANGGDGGTPAQTKNAPASETAPRRRPGLIERLTGVDKSAATSGNR